MMHRKLAPQLLEQPVTFMIQAVTFMIQAR